MVMQEVESDAPFTAAYDIARRALGWDCPPTLGGRLGVTWALGAADALTLHHALDEAGFKVYVTDRSRT